MNLILSKKLQKWIRPNDERAKNRGVLGEEIFCPRADEFFCPPPQAAGNFRTSFVSCIYESNSAR